MVDVWSFATGFLFVFDNVEIQFDIDWNQPWHTILHSWHNRIDQQLEYHGLKIWSAKYLSEYWKFANYVAVLDENR